MLTLTRTPLSLVTNRHYAMGGSSGGRRGGAGKGGKGGAVDDYDKDDEIAPRRRSARVTEKENNDRNGVAMDDGFAFKSKAAKAGGTRGVTAATKKVNADATGPATDATSTTMAGTKRKQTYDQDDGGFTFSRAKSKRSKTTPTPETNFASLSLSKVVEPPAAVVEERERPEEQEKPTRKRGRKPGPKKGLATEAKKQTQSDYPPVTVRDPWAASDVEQEPLPIEVKKKRQRRKSPPPAQDLEVETASNSNNNNDAQAPLNARTPVAAGTTKIALPFADTPIIRRNQEMRRRASGVAPDGKAERNGRGARRSSLGQRGRRASSLIDSGRSAALPHDAVDSAEFFKHIEAGLPEPRRMRQLLTWCATRALGGDGGPNGKAKSKANNTRDSVTGPDSHVRLAAREIQNQILKDLGARGELSDWFGRPDEVETGRETVLKKPNPRNEANERKIRELEAQLARLQAERSTWESLLRPPGKAPLLTPLPSSLPDLDALDPSLLTTSNAAILASLRSLDLPIAPVPQQEARRRLEAAGSGLEFHADQLADSTHVLGQYRSAAGRVADKILDDAKKALDVRARKERERIGGKDSAAGSAAGDRADDVGVRDVLRGLSRVEPR